jgi:hypothetical protein
MAKIFWIAKKVDDTMQMWGYNNKRKAQEKGLELYGVGITDFSFKLDGEEFEDEDGNTAFIYSGQIDAIGCFLLYRADAMPGAIGLEFERAATEYVESELPNSAGACFPAKLKGGSCDVYMSSAVEANSAMWTFEDGEVNESKKEAYDMKSIQTFEAFTHNVVNEKITLGSYYFSRYAFDGFDLPAKGETSYALVIHNTVEVNGESMYLRSKNDHNVGAGFRPKVVAVAEDQDSIEAAYKTHVKTGGEGANLSISYGSFNVKGQNCAYTEIDGITKKLK